MCKEGGQLKACTNGLFKLARWFVNSIEYPETILTFPGWDSCLFICVNAYIKARDFRICPICPFYVSIFESIALLLIAEVSFGQAL